MNSLRVRRFGVRGSVVVAALAIAASAAPAAAQPQVITGLVTNTLGGCGSDPNVLLATIPAVPGQTITIIRVGIGGDASTESGPQAFQLVGAGLDFTWGAGQNLAPQVPLDFTLSPTVAEGGSPAGGRGFTYSADLNQTGNAGQAIQIRWRGTSDCDGLSTWGTDSEGNFFSDSATETSSARAWVLYQYSGPQATLDGMPRVAEWTDFENQSGEIPPKVWGSCDLQKADRIGIKVDFQNGISSYAVYHGVANLWNVYNFSPILPDSSGGFLGSCGGIHWLFNDSGTFPLAWDGCTMAYSTNFDLEYSSQYGSHFRADSAGWVQATFQTYCGAAGGQPVTPVVGLWWNPNESGSGYNIDVKHGVLVMTVFSYKASGEQEWYITSGPITNGSFTGTLDRYVGGQCISCTYNGLPTSAGNAGVVTINFTSPVAATMLLPGGRVTNIQPEAF